MPSRGQLKLEIARLTRELDAIDTADKAPWRAIDRYRAAVERVRAAEDELELAQREQRQAMKALAKWNGRVG